MLESYLAEMVAMSELGVFTTASVALLLRELLKNRSLESLASGHVNPAAFKRRAYDILRGKTERVSLRVADEICNAVGRPDLLQTLEEG